MKILVSFYNLFSAVLAVVTYASAALGLFTNNALFIVLLVILRLIQVYICYYINSEYST